jgi:hypothetical protein
VAEKTPKSRALPLTNLRKAPQCPRAVILPNFAVRKATKPKPRLPPTDSRDGFARTSRAAPEYTKCIGVFSLRAVAGGCPIRRCYVWGF